LLPLHFFFNPIPASKKSTKNAHSPALRVKQG
jgi:hypothetical protein